jgi:hypothetical protein
MPHISIHGVRRSLITLFRVRSFRAGRHGDPIRKLLTLSIVIIGIALLAVPTRAQIQQYGSSATTAISCDHFTRFGDINTPTTTELVPLSAGKTIYLCGFHMIASGATTATLVYGTGTNCGTGPTNITDDFDLTAQVGIVDHGAVWHGMKTAVSNALCIKNSAAFKNAGGVYWTQF